MLVCQVQLAVALLPGQLLSGVYWYARSQKWNAEIGLKGKIYNLGRFTNKQDAINARKEAEAKYFKPILEKYGKEAESDGTTSHSRMDHPSTSATPDNL